MRAALFALFAVSGVTGLVYESIWSHYLGLMLGHAAYAQTLVLAIFMGGMAFGAWIASRRSERWRNPLLAYALIEGVIGVLALAFHGGFVSVLDLLYRSWIPGVEQAGAVTALKWSVGAALILPQSILLGTTFPLISAGLIRIAPGSAGATLGLLYFSNSIGAAAGALLSGFLLIPWVGLPGTIRIAGLVNVLLACAVWGLARGRSAASPPGRSDESAARASDWPWLGAALVTGAASFCYEIGWIRMLNLVLGTTTQSFELMLSAFLTGLALGGLAVRRWLDGGVSPLRLAGRIQVLMGLCALLTLPLYGATFDFMAFLLARVGRTDGGYALFNLGSHAVALAVMLPATVLAGMTLPAFTFALIRSGRGERSVGRVYAANTLGAILGVLAAVHWIMPAVGTRGLVVAAAAADIVLGLAFLVAGARAGVRRREPWIAAAVAAAALGFVLVGVRVDLRKTASGVYRHGSAHLPAESEVVYHKDGKTATIDLIRDPAGRLKISTNGKPDAEIAPAGQASAPDEITQVLLGALPLALHPGARSVANIGMGSGMTTHTVLGAATIERVDTIEIERAMVEAARGFGDRVERAYSDPRSRIHIEDAKTFFSGHRERYDVIISEPSNPWVSGVASLFSEEFYGHVREHLAADGLLVQWLQLYETNLDLLSSIFAAIESSFPGYVVFNTDNANILIVAANTGAIGPLDPWVFAETGLARDLRRVGIVSLADLEIRRIGSGRLLAPVFERHAARANSDYFPYVAHAAPKSRFLGQTAVDLTRLHVAPLPVLELLDRERGVPGRDFPSAETSFTPARARLEARDLALALGVHATPSGTLLQADLRAALPALLASGTVESDPGLEPELLRGLRLLAGATNPYLASEDLAPMWESITGWPGLHGLSPVGRRWLALHGAVASRDGRAMLEIGTSLLEDPAPLDERELEYLVAAGLAGALATEDRPAALRIAGVFRMRHPPGGEPPPFHLDLLLAHAER